MFYKLQF